MNHVIEFVDALVAKNTPEYLVRDLKFEHLTVSKTILNPGKSTRGHSHDGIEEVYIFQRGSGQIQIGDVVHRIHPGAMYIIPAGVFHKVENYSSEDTLVFTCIFENYNREDANYEKK